MIRIRPAAAANDRPEAACPAGQFVYPYDVRVIRGSDGHDKVYASCWNDAAIAVVDPRRGRVTERIAVGSHPNAMIATAGRRAPVRREREHRHRVGHHTWIDRELDGSASVSATGPYWQQPPGARAQRRRSRAVRGQRADPVDCRGSGWTGSLPSGRPARRIAMDNGDAGEVAGERAQPASSDSYPPHGTPRRWRWSAPS